MISCLFKHSRRNAVVLQIFYRSQHFLDERRIRGRGAVVGFEHSGNFTQIFPHEKGFRGSGDGGCGATTIQICYCITEPGKAEYRKPPSCLCRQFGQHVTFRRKCLLFRDNEINPLPAILYQRGNFLDHGIGFTVARTAKQESYHAFLLSVQLSNIHVFRRITVLPRHEKARAANSSSVMASSNSDVNFVIRAC